MKAIEIHDVSFSYDGETPVLSHLSLDIEQGTYNVLLGHNGSGKSTLSKILMGLLDIHEGNIIINGLPLVKDNYDIIRKDMAIVFQNPDNQFIASSVEEDIAFALENRCVEPKIMQQKVHEIANKFAIEHLLTKAPEELSGGQKQRVALVGALIYEPKILLLDEATSMLDPRGKRQINTIIDCMRKDHKDLTIISITHDVETASNADKVIILNKGSLVAYDSPNNIFNNEKLIKDNNLTIPFLWEIKNKFLKKGIDITDALTLREVVEKLCPSK